MTPPLSWALQEMVVQACGTAFWYKRPLQSLLVRAGVPGPLVTKYSNESKYVMVRSILAELDSHGERGIRVQHSIVRELASIKSVTDPSVDRKAAQEALDDLRKTARDEGALEDPAAKTAEATRQQRAAAKARISAVEDQHKELEKLCERYRALVTNEGAPQDRGYALEALIGDLFNLYRIPYHPPYRKGTVEQTDGFFTFNGFQYLIESRWRKKPPTINDLRAFSLKVEAKIESTRGLFVSVAGFRDEVLVEAKPIRNVIYVSGQDLAHILEGRNLLPQALTVKIDQAARHGVFFYSLQNHV
jgi:hypothetical protein